MLLMLFMTATDDNPARINTSDFLKFLFSTLFLFATCLSLILYIPNVMALMLNFLLRSIILPRHTLLSIGSIEFSPLRARIFFRNLYFQNENASLKIVDGYFTFDFWGYWFQSTKWTTVRDSMVKDSLIGTRCRARVNFKFTKGTIVGIEAEKRRIFVQLDPNAADSLSDEDSDVCEGDQALGEDGYSRKAPRGENGDEADANTQDSFPSEEPAPAHQGRLEAILSGTRGGGGASRRGGGGAGGDPFVTRVPVKETGLPSSSTPTGAGLNGHSATGDEIVKLFDPTDVRIRSRSGLCQLHANGTRLCLYNATGKYKDLLNGAPYTDSPANDAKEERRQEDGRETNATVRRLLKVLKGKMRERDVDTAQDKDTTHRAAGFEAAKKLQLHQLANKTFMQKFFNFIGALEVELFASTIDIGGANGPHPYFLHITTLRSEGRIFITRDGCCPIDLYRTAGDFTMQQVDMRMAPMDSTLTDNQVMRNTSLRERARLMFNGTANRLSGTDAAFTAGATEASSDLIRHFGILVDGKDKGSVHILFYRDMPNVYAGEEIRREALPRTGCEVVLDTPTFRYGPWLEYCRFQMWQYFLPPNFRPLQPLEFVVGKPRPNAGVEFFVEFMRETRFEVPFKRRAVAPSPPFGIKDSHEIGMLTATVGAGSQYIQKGVFLLPGEDKQNFEALFVGKNITAWSNSVLGREALLCQIDSLQLFLDRQDDVMWNGRKLWNILPKLSGAALYFFTVHVDFFLDLLNDWQFAANMYHHVPLTTELFNTYERAVRDFVPNVKRFEVFLDGFATVYVNVNAQNVVYAHDPCDVTRNTFAILKVQQASFSMVLPSDQYQLSSRNEVTRPFEVVGKEIKAYVSLPPSHPLFPEVSAEIPFAYSEHALIKGSFVINVGNQSIPLDKNPVIPETGRTKLRNYLNLDIEFANMHGTLMGPHIMGLLNCFENIFLDNTMTIAPDELFWLLAKLQSHAATGKNRRKELKQYMESKAPIGNDLEICVLVRLIDVEATLATSQAKGTPGVLLSTAQVNFSYVKQFACTDTAVTLAPLLARFCDAHGRIPRSGSENFLATGHLRVGLCKHFGRMPLKPKVHESLDVHVDGIALQMDMEELVVLLDVLRTVEGHVKAHDMVWVAAVDEARAVAEYAAEQRWRGPQRRLKEQGTPWWQDERQQQSDTAMSAFYFENSQICRDARRREGRAAGGRRGGSHGKGGGDAVACGGRVDGAQSSGGGGDAGRRERYTQPPSAPAGRTVLTGGTGTRMRTPFDGLPFQSSNVFDADVTSEASFEMTRLGSSEAGGGMGLDDNNNNNNNDNGNSDGWSDASGGDNGALEFGKRGGTKLGADRRVVIAAPDAPPGTGFSALAPHEGPPLRNLFREYGAFRGGGGAGPLSAGSELADVPIVLPLHATESGAVRHRKARGSSMLHRLGPMAGFADKNGKGGNGYGSSRGSRSSSPPGSDGSSDTSGYSSVDGIDAEPSLAFANSIPRDIAQGFAYFMEEVNKAEDDAKDYGLFFTHVVVARVSGALRVPEGGFIALDLPNGVILAQSSLNDGNSSQRMSVAVRDVSVRGLTERRFAFAKYSIPTADAIEMGDHVEVFHLQTSICMRRFVAYPFDGSLERHRERQRQFIEANDYEDLIRYAFFPEERQRKGDRTNEGPHGRHSPPVNQPLPTHRHDGQHALQRHQPQQQQYPHSANYPLPRDPQSASSPDAAHRPLAAPLNDPPTLPRLQRRQSPSGPGANHFVSKEGYGVNSSNSNASASVRASDGDPAEGPSATLSPTTMLAHTFAYPDPTQSFRGISHRLRVAEAGGSPRTGNLTRAALVEPLQARPLERNGDASARPAVALGGLNAAAETAATGLGPSAPLGSDEEQMVAGSDNCGDTTAHTGERVQGGSDDDFRTVNSLGDPHKSDLLTSGAHFATCMSASDFSDVETESGSMSSMVDGLVGPSGIESSVFAADREGQGHPTDPRPKGGQGHDPRHVRRRGGTPGAGNYCLQEPIPMYYFSRTFFKDEDEGPTRLDFRVPRRPTRNRPIRDRTHFSAPLPSVRFTASDATHYSPEFFMSSVLAAEAEAAGFSGVGENTTTGAGETLSTRVPFAWAMRTADNRERSKAGSTTKHVHVETVAPVAVLVTTQAAELAAAAVGVFMNHTNRQVDAAARRLLLDDSTLLMQQLSNASVSGGGGRNKRPKVAAFAKQAAQRKSRTRERQKRWLSEDTILSLLVSCVELKLLTALPVPPENLPDPRTAVEGMYCSTVTVRDISFHSWQNHPPAGVEIGMDATRRMSGSLKVAAISLVTQIEYEPILREGNLHVHIPGVLYDMEKDTTAVLYLSDLRFSGKQDTVRGTEGGACHVSLHRVSAHLTRDFLDYLLSLRLVGQDVAERVTAKMHARNDGCHNGYASSPVGSPASASSPPPAVWRVREGPSGGSMSCGAKPLGVRNGRGASTSDGDGALYGHGGGRPSDKPETHINPFVLLGGSVSGGTVQGKGSVAAIELVIVDSRKEGRLIRVDIPRATSLDIANPTASFILMTPHRSRDRHVQLQCVGEVEQVRAMLFPSLLYTLHARERQLQWMNTASSLPSSPTFSSGTGHASHQRRHGSLTREANAAGVSKTVSRVTFSEDPSKVRVESEKGETRERGNAAGTAPATGHTPTVVGGATAPTAPSTSRKASAFKSESKSKGKGKAKASPASQSSPLKGSAAVGSEAADAAAKRTADSTRGSPPSAQPPPHTPIAAPPPQEKKSERTLAEQPRGQAATSTSTPPAASKKESLAIMYNCSFALRSLNVSLLHAEMNYVQLRGHNLMGCADSRGEWVSSRECIQMEVLTEAISEPIRERLRRLARAARTRAAQSRYAAPASTSEQLQLKAGMCFFMQSLLLNYVADPLIPQRKVGRTALSAGEGGKDAAQRQRQRMLDAQVAVAIVEDVAISAQVTNQYDIVGEQVNVTLHVKKVLVDLPYFINAEEVIHPQIRLFLAAWRRALKSMTKPVTTTTLSSASVQSANAMAASSNTSRSQRGGITGRGIAPPPLDPQLAFLSAMNPEGCGAGGGGGGSGPTLPKMADGAAKKRTANWNSAFFITVQAERLETVVGLPQNIRQRLLVPEISLFLQGSSDKRLSAKFHLHPFTITSKLTDDEPNDPNNYAVTLPNIFVLYAHDAIKMTTSIMMETIAITVTPLFINHMLLTYEKVSGDVLAVFSKFEGLDGGNMPQAGESSSPTSSVGSPGTFSCTQVASPAFQFPPPQDACVCADVLPADPAPHSGHRTPAKPTKHRESILFLLQGLRVSYLTSVTNLRFTVRRINAIADTTSHPARDTLKWVVHVSNAQVALVDRNDHDQMVAAIDSAMRRSQTVDVEEDVEAAMGGSATTISRGSRIFSRYRNRRPGHAFTAMPLNTRNSVSSAGLDSSGLRCSHRRAGYSGAASSIESIGRQQAASGASTNTTTVDEAHRLRAVHPVSGYIWGSAELSLTLSSGKMDSTRGKTALQENASFTSYSTDLQKALLDTLGHTSSQWELSIYSPLVIIRFGLVELLRMCFDETRDDIDRMKTAASQESERFRVELTKHKAFRKLQREKRRYDALLKHTEKERVAQLRRMTAQVASDVSRHRGGFALNDNETRMVLDYFNITKEHSFVATISHFLAVVPFGDAAFRSLLQDVPDTYACGRAHRHIHTASCMNREKFIPTLALKLRIEETSLVFSLEAIKRFAPAFKLAGFHTSDTGDMNRGSSGHSDTATAAIGMPSRRAHRSEQTAESDYVSSFRFFGRFLATNTFLYFTDGSRVDDSTNLAGLIADTGILGGVGILSEYAGGELRQSRNTLYVACIECPVHLDRKDGATKIGAVFDLTGPRVQLSSRFANILSEFVMEEPPEPLYRAFHHRQGQLCGAGRGDRRGGGRHRPPADATTAPSPNPQPTRTAAPGTGDGHRHQPRDKNEGEGATPHGPLHDSPRIHVDVSARLAAGHVSMFAFSKPTNPNDSASGGPHGTGAASINSKFSRRVGMAAAARRRVAFGASAADDRNNPRTTSGSGSSGGLPSALGQFDSPDVPCADQSQIEASALFAQSEEFMESLLTVPLPGVLVQVIAKRGGTIFEEDYTSARIEVRAGTVGLSPSITSLAHEIEACAKVYSHNQQERRVAILSRVRSLEKEIADLSVPLHCTVEDVLLPMPSALCNALATARMRTAIDLKRSTRSVPAPEPVVVDDDGGTRAGGCVHMSAETKHKRTAMIAAAESLTVSSAKPVSKSFTGIHITLTTLRVTFTAEPITSTAFTVFLHERSSIDLLVKIFKRPEPTNRFVNKFPDISLTLCAHSLRAECQTKLEVKSLEISLPEAELMFSKRHGTVGVINTLTANFPLSAQEADPNIILRTQHMSQLTMVLQLWTTTLKDMLRSVRRLTARGAPVDVVAQRVREMPLGQRVKSSAAVLTPTVFGTSERLVASACVSRGRARVDLGAGNTHQLFFGIAHAAMESATHDNGSNVLLLIANLSNVSVRSEGVLAGIVSVSGVLFQAFVIRNKKDGLDFERSPEGRTFRQTMAVSNVNMTYKERQLRDIFECKVGRFVGNSMDGIGEEGYTTTDLDVTLSQATLGVTPSTVPAVLNFVRTVSAVVSEQQRIALQRLTSWGRGRHGTSDDAPRSSLRSGSGDGCGVMGVCCTPLPASSMNDGHSRHTPGGDSAADRQRNPSPAATHNSTNKEAGTLPLSPSAAGSSKREHRDCQQPAFIPFMGNRLMRIPCGQLRFTLEETTLMLGSTSSSSDAAAANSVVASFPRARLSFAECPCDDYTAVKKALIIESHSAELYRPGTPRVVIMGFKGVNVFDFYAHQVLGSQVVGFTLALRQTHPWTGNPRFRDFKEMIMLIKSFTDKQNATVFRRFGQVETDELAEASMMGADSGGGGGVGLSAPSRVATEGFFSEARTPTRGNAAPELPFGGGDGASRTPKRSAPGSASGGDTEDASAARSQAGVRGAVLQSSAGLQSDVRQLRSLGNAKFSPQLRFGGDVSVNTEVILNWIGITGKMLPNVVNAKLCDKLENVLSALTDAASERTISTDDEKKERRRCASEAHVSADKR